MDLVSVPGVAGPNLAPRITFSYAPVNMQALADGTHVGRDAGHSGHSHGHAHGAHGHGHGHSHGAHGHSHAHTASHQIPGPPAMPPSHQTHAHQQPAAAHSHSHGQEHTSASGECMYVCACVCYCSSSINSSSRFAWVRKAIFPFILCRCSEAEERIQHQILYYTLSLGRAG